MSRCTRNLTVKIFSRHPQMIVRPSPFSASHRPRTKKQSKNGHWSSHSTSRVTSYARRITSLPSLNEEQGKFYESSGRMGVDDLNLRSFVNIHLLSLLDGSPHELPLQKVIALDLRGYRNPMVINTQISCSRIALLIEHSGLTADGTNRQLVAWDWKTGEVVCNFSSWGTDFNPTSTQVFRSSSGYTAMGRAISGISTMSFLDGSWLLVLYHEGPNPQLLVLNTLLPQRDPKSWRILGLPLPGTPRCYTQYENAPMEHPQFSVDPAQRIVVVVSMDNCALIIPVELLIRRMHSLRIWPYIRFDEWMKDVTAVPFHHPIHTLQVFDVKILALSGSVRRPEGWGVRMFDLSKSGRRDAQLLRDDEGVVGGCRRVLLTPKWFARCDVLGDGIPRSTRIVGNRVVCFYVSPLCAQGRSCLIQCCAVQYKPSDPDGAYFLRVLKMG